MTRGAELQRIAREGKRIRTSHLEVRVAASPFMRSEGESTTGHRGRVRVGLVVPKYKQSAVARNRLKRQLRELARLHLLPTEVAADVVLRIRPDAYLAPFDALMDEMRQVLAQLLRWHRGSTPASDIR